MKKIINYILVLFVNSLVAQKEMKTNTGNLFFEASVPLFEEVCATNKTVICVLNLKNGQLSSIVQMKDFRFKLALMEEHFNKKYLETENFPEAYFRGTIEGFNFHIIDTNPKEFKLKGKIEIHGKSKKIETIVYLNKEKNGLEINSNFELNTKDFNIVIPELLSMKIAKTVSVKYHFWIN